MECLGVARATRDAHHTLPAALVKGAHYRGDGPRDGIAVPKCAVVVATPRVKTARRVDGDGVAPPAGDVRDRHPHQRCDALGNARLGQQPSRMLMRRMTL